MALVAAAVDCCRNMHSVAISRILLSAQKLCCFYSILRQLKHVSRKSLQLLICNFVCSKY